MTKLRIWLILVMLWVVIGSTYITIEIAIDTIPPFLMSGIRYVLSGVLLILVYILLPSQNINYQIKLNQKSTTTTSHRSKLESILDKRQWKEATIIGAALILGGQGLLTWGEQYLSSSFTALLFSTVPIWILLLGKILYNEKLKKFTVLGVIVGSIGFIILILPSLAAQFLDTNSPSTNNLELVGIFALVIAALSWSVGSLYSSKANLPVNVLVSTGMMLFVGGFFLIALSIATGELENFHISSISIESMTSLIYLITVGSAGWAGFFWILRNTSASLANTFAYVSPVVAVILGWAILSEAITVQIVFATLIIMSGVILIANRGKF
ncbi:EamA family transporter [Candidatus Nitrosocosmicus hydrocola]|uniref:EamA family transporter n=1 Tax=Candidatus Nitrosocosmicus hydrocola TaxID=1826872 RepID=UPI0011E58A73|nr:EamA family transporter [Candidatus Nitrosocosmicus hydrocola]